jgi:hypothetical protein
LASGGAGGPRARAAKAGGWPCGSVGPAGEGADGGWDAPEPPKALVSQEVRDDIPQLENDGRGELDAKEDARRLGFCAADEDARRLESAEGTLGGSRQNLALQNLALLYEWSSAFWLKFDISDEWPSAFWLKRVRSRGEAAMHSAAVRWPTEALPFQAPQGRGPGPFYPAGRKMSLSGTDDGRLTLLPSIGFGRYYLSLTFPWSRSADPFFTAVISRARSACLGRPCSRRLASEC